MVLHCLESKKGPGKGASLFVAVKAASEAVCCSGGVVSTHGGWRAAGGASKPEAAAHTVRNSLLAAFSCTATLCSEMAKIVQKVALVGYIHFGSSWLLFGELT